jgi:hypothetical protein
MRRVLGRCQGEGCLNRAVHRHHVVYEQEIERRGGNKRDPRWFMALCMNCHFEHHNPGVDAERKLPLRLIPDEAIEAAYELMGAYAYDYLRRRYRGEDARVDALLEAA